MAEFNPGQKGSFSDKRKEIKLLLESSNPIEFLSFGPSGLDHSEVCNVEKRLRSSKAVTIFDVWPRDTLDELLETEQLVPRDRNWFINVQITNEFLGSKSVSALIKKI